MRRSARRRHATTRVKITGASRSAGMIIVTFDFADAPRFEDHL